MSILLTLELITSSNILIMLLKILNISPPLVLNNSLCICFSGLDGTNPMSGEEKVLQHLICHTAPHSQYFNCRNHRLALCLVHLIPCYRKLLELDGVLLSLWKTFECSFIKQAIFEQAQKAPNLKFLKVLKNAQQDGS